MIEVTVPAVEKLKSILVEEDAPNSAIRVIMVPAGRGAQYMLTLESEANDDDVVNDYDGVRILVDGDAAPIMEGAQIDYVEDLMRSGFVITNPNLPAAGGCGSGGCGSGGCGGNCACGAGI